MKQFIRNFNKQKVVGLLNISSLSLGVMVAVIVGLWTINELSFDNFHKNKERIYRINVHAILNKAPTKIGSSFKPLGEEAKAKLPQIETMSRVFPTYNDLKINTTYYPDVKALIAGGLFQSPFMVKRIYGKNFAQPVDFPVGRDDSLAVTLLTTGFQTWTVATTNPVKTLKSE